MNARMQEKNEVGRGWGHFVSTVEILDGRQRCARQSPPKMYPRAEDFGKPGAACGNSSRMVNSPSWVATISSHSSSFSAPPSSPFWPSYSSARLLWSRPLHQNNQPEASQSWLPTLLASRRYAPHPASRSTRLAQNHPEARGAAGPPPPDPPTLPRPTDRPHVFRLCASLPWPWSPERPQSNR